MSKKSHRKHNKHTFKFKIPTQRDRLVSDEVFLQAIQRAEFMTITMIQEKDILPPVVETLTLLALCTISALDNNLSFHATDQEIHFTITRILSHPDYIPGSDFPYTKEQLLAGWESAL